MKNKLLVSVFAVAIAAFAFTSCETKSDVTGVCTDMIKETLHKNARSLETLDGQTLRIAEYEFLGGVNDSRLAYRTIAFGNGINEPKKVDTLSYEYGEWIEHGTAFTLLVTPAVGDPYTLVYQGNTFKTPDNRVIGGEGSANSARVEKWERTIASFSNSDWEATFQDKFVVDSILEDSIKKTIVTIVPMVIRYDTIKVFKGKMDTLNADTTCNIRFEVKRDPVTLANTGHLYRECVRSTYNRETQKADTISRDVTEYDCNWFFSDVSSDSKFTITLESTTEGEKGEALSISAYKVDDAGVANTLKLGGLTYTRPAQP